MAKPKVVVTRKLPPSVEAEITERFDAHLNANDVAMTPGQIAEAMKYADGLLCTVGDRITEEHFWVDRRTVKVVANFGVGVNHIDCAAAKKSRGGRYEYAGCSHR